MENSELITKALAYIRSENKKSEMTIDDVADHAGFSTNYFNRIFFAHTGFNVMEYVRFSRMKKATRLLRTTDRDILDIALECGYEAHESFSRAFKKQYGITPMEYRKNNEKKEAVYGDFYNDTIGERLIHEFKDFKIADTDEVIDYMLENYGLKYGYTAICCHTNGGVAVYSGEDFHDGFIWFAEWNERFHGDIVSEDYNKIAEYLKIFCDDRFDMNFYTLDDDETIKNELSKQGIEVGDIKRFYQNVYTSEPYDITAPKGITMREIKYDDYETVRSYCVVHGVLNGYRDYLKHELHQRDVLGNTEHSVFIFGIFKGDKLIGLSLGGLQRVHGFVINNCVTTTIDKELESEELFQYAFKLVTNAALEKGALPFDDVQNPYIDDEGKSGKFNSTDLGYRTVSCSCDLKYKKSAHS